MNLPSPESNDESYDVPKFANKFKTAVTTFNVLAEAARDAEVREQLVCNVGMIRQREERALAYSTVALAADYERFDFFEHHPTFCWQDARSRFLSAKIDVNAAIEKVSCEIQVLEEVVIDLATSCDDATTAARNAKLKSVFSSFKELKGSVDDMFDSAD